MQRSDLRKRNNVKTFAWMLSHLEHGKSEDKQVQILFFFLLFKDVLEEFSQFKLNLMFCVEAAGQRTCLEEE